MWSSLNVDNTFSNKGVGLGKWFDILSISETWYISFVTKASVEIPGYRIFRFDRIGKTGAGDCAYVKSALKVKVLKDLTRITKSGLQKLWIQVQNKKLHSLLVHIINRPSEIEVMCVENE